MTEKLTPIFYPLVLDDGNRHLSKRPGQFNDCSVRTFAIITGLPYDHIYNTFARAGRRPCDGFDSPTWLKRRKGRAFGGVFKPIKVTGRDDRYSMRPHLTPLNFGTYHPRGHFILETSNHTWAMINGIHHDLWRVKQDRPLTGAWQWLPGKNAVDKLTETG